MLKVGSLDQPYITSTNGVARTDPRRFLSDSDRKLTSKFRGRGDLVSMKERKISVGHFSRSLSTMHL